MVITREALHGKNIARRTQKLQRRVTTVASEVFVCVDWGASYWRHYDSSLGGTSKAEPSMVVYNKEKNEFLSGEKASNAWLTSDVYIRFQNLKKLFDTESNYYKEECDRVHELCIPITVEDMLEHWWLDRFGALLKRIAPNHKIKFGIAHPAYFSPSSVQKYRDFFSKSREGHEFEVVVSEESTAALHGSRYSGFQPDDLVLVLDGGKSTIDCACLRISSVEPSLTTEIYKTDGLSFGGDFVNQTSIDYADPIVHKYKTSANEEVARLIGGADFERTQRNWWHFFETIYKKDLNMHRDILQKVDCIPVEGLFQTVEHASSELAKSARVLVENMIHEMELIAGKRPDVIICLGGYCQSKELRKELCYVLPKPQFEYNGSDGNDVIDGLRSLVHHPERAAWQFSPQHYLITQQSEEDEEEALLLYRQGDALAKCHDKVQLLSPNELTERKRNSKTPYHIPGHLIAMDVKLDSDQIQPGESIFLHVEIRTADLLKTSPNKRGFQVSKLEDTTLLRTYDVALPSNYRDLFQKRKTLTMYNCVALEGQEVVVFTIRPLEKFFESEVEWLIEWMTLSEILGTFSTCFDIFRTSVKVTAAYRQTSKDHNTRPRAISRRKAREII